VGSSASFRFSSITQPGAGSSSWHRQHYRWRLHPDVPGGSRVALPRILVLILDSGAHGGDHPAHHGLSRRRLGRWHPGVVAIIFGLILMASYGIPGSGLTMIWVAAIWGLVGGVLMVIQAFRQRKA